MNSFKKITAKHLKAFKLLAQSLMCPGCKKIVHSPFYNLGPKHNWSEGCKECQLKYLGKLNE